MIQCGGLESRSLLCYTLAVTDNRQEDQTMKKYRVTAIVFFLCALAFYALAVFNICNEETRVFGIVWMSVGSMWLCLGTACLNKSLSDSDPDSGNDLDDKGE